MKANSQWSDLAKHYDVAISSLGLILPSKDRHMLDSKIAKDLLDVRHRIKQAHQQSRDVIFLPGSFDLVHAGHLSYLDQVTQQYLIRAAKLGRKLSRQKLFIVMLADDDHLIELVKASKHVSYGGQETFSRPIEKGLDSNGRSIRLDTLASLPVDCVGFIPSPAADNLPAPYKLDFEFCQKLAKQQAKGEELEKFQRILHAYQDLSKLMRAHQDLKTMPWKVAAWQLYIHLAIANPSRGLLKQEPLPYSGKNITRIVSMFDAHYMGMVKMLCRWAAVAVDVIEDKQLISTTSLLQEYGPAALLQQKSDSLS